MRDAERKWWTLQEALRWIAFGDVSRAFATEFLCIGPDPSPAEVATASRQREAAEAEMAMLDDARRRLKESVAQEAVAAEGVPYRAGKPGRAPRRAREPIPPEFMRERTHTFAPFNDMTMHEGFGLSAEAIEYRDVMLRAEDVRQAFPANAGAGSAIIATGAPGRPSKSKHLIQDEHERRLAAGEALPSLAAEAKFLHEWLRQTHAQAQRPTIAAIQNNIRKAHRQHPANATK